MGAHRIDSAVTKQLSDLRAEILIRDLLYRDPEISSLRPIPLAARPRPPELPSVLQPAAPKEGTCVLQDACRAEAAVPGDDSRTWILLGDPATRPR